MPLDHESDGLTGGTSREKRHSVSARAAPGSQPSSRRVATTAPTIAPACKSIARQVSAPSELIPPCSVATRARNVSGVNTGLGQLTGDDE